mmetsp:Transcript_20601/g.67219  ORF Transcript_20601/g.67219 Transcript_20601/m.67219 type:complete len:270 (+) Transcript_20601:262-1071(+)
MASTPPAFSSSALRRALPARLAIRFWQPSWAAAPARDPPSRRARPARCWVGRPPSPRWCCSTPTGQREGFSSSLARGMSAGPASVTRCCSCWSATLRSTVSARRSRHACRRGTTASGWCPSPPPPPALSTSARSARQTAPATGSATASVIPAATPRLAATTAAIATRARAPTPPPPSARLAALSRGAATRSATRSATRHAVASTATTAPAIARPLAPRRGSATAFATTSATRGLAAGTVATASETASRWRASAARGAAPARGSPMGSAT